MQGYFCHKAPVDFTSKLALLKQSFHFLNEATGTWGKKSQILSKSEHQFITQLKYPHTPVKHSPSLCLLDALSLVVH